MLTADNADEVYAALTALAGSMPAFTSGGDSREKHEWLGKLYALLNAAGEYIDAMLVRTATGNVAQGLKSQDVNNIEAALFRSHAMAQLKAKADVTSTFIPVGKSFDAFASLAKVIRKANHNVLLIDPYADATLLTDFADLANNGVRVSVLVANRCKSALAPGVEKWHDQHGSTRPLEVRAATDKLLHDRLILLDDSTGYALSQSFKDLAKRSPATLLAIDPEIAALKLAHYRDLWQNDCTTVP